MIFITAPHPFQLIRKILKKFRQFKEVQKSFPDLFSLQEEAWDQQQVGGQEQSTQEGGEEGQGGEEQVVS